LSGPIETGERQVAGTRYFTTETFQFLRDLKANNDRDWFVENKSRYEEHLKAPALRLIQAFGEELPGISPHFAATPRSLYRIHRDTRFSKDKSPYKTSAGVHFRHEQAKTAHAPGYYLHIEPGSVFLGIGSWRPESAALRKIREHLAENPADWKRASRAKKFTESFELAGESLKRPPKGFDPEHPQVEDLKRKDFIAVASVPDSFATASDLPERLAETFSAGSPYMRFLCEALGVPF
jgi:uncharacterized protein (TIGR02453 family)